MRRGRSTISVMSFIQILPSCSYSRQSIRSMFIYRRTNRRRCIYTARRARSGVLCFWVAIFWSIDAKASPASAMRSWRWIESWGSVFRRRVWAKGRGSMPITIFSSKILSTIRPIPSLSINASYNSGGLWWSIHPSYALTRIKMRW